MLLRRSPPLEAPGVFESYDFTTAGRFDPFVTAWNGPTSGNPTSRLLKSLLIGTTAYIDGVGNNKLIRWDRDGLRLEPANTNEATNPRMEGAAGGTLSSGSADQSCTVESFADSHIFTIHKVAHGRSKDDRIYFPANVTVGGRTIVAGSAAGTTAYDTLGYTIFDVTADAFNIYYYQPAISSGTSAATNFRYRTWATSGTLPTGHSIAPSGGYTIDSTRLIRVQRYTGPSSSPLIGSSVEYNIAGTGVGYELLKNVACTQGQDISFSQPCTLFPRRGGGNDDQSFDNISFWIAFVEKDGSGNVLRETVVDMMPYMVTTFAYYIILKASATAQHASCASVDVCHKYGGVTGCDHNLHFREYAISKTKHRISPALPNTIASGGSLVAISRLAETCDDLFASHTIYGARVTFKCDEIVAATDTIVSFEGAELQAIGTSWPRDLRLTDGVNHVTLTGALRNLWSTQQCVRVAMSFGPNGLVLAVTDSFCNISALATTGAFTDPTVSGTNASYGGAISNRYRIGRDSGSLRPAAFVIKTLKLEGGQLTLAQCKAASKLTSDLTWVGGVPGVDFMPGRTSVATLKSVATGDIPASGTFGPSACMTRSTNNRIVLNASAVGITIEDFDFRGFYISPNTPRNDVTWKNCIFDQSFYLASIANTYPVTSVSSSSTGWIFENCTFLGGSVDAWLTSGARNTWNGMIALYGTGCIIRKCIFYDACSDTIASPNAITFEDSITIQTNRTQLGSHADVFQISTVTNQDCLIQRCLCDFRELHGTRVNPNTIANANTGDTVGNISKTLKFKDLLLFGGYNQVDANSVGPGTSTTIPGLIFGDGRIDFENVVIGLSPSTPVDVVLNQKQLVFGNAGVQFAAYTGGGGRNYWQNLLGMWATTPAWPANWRAGAIRTTSQGTPTTSTLINGFDFRPGLSIGASAAVNDAVDITVGGVTERLTVKSAGTASGNNEINVNDPISTLISKLEALHPTLAPITFSTVPSSRDIRDYFSGDAL